MRVDEFDELALGTARKVPGYLEEVKPAVVNEYEEGDNQFVTGDIRMYLQAKGQNDLDTRDINIALGILAFNGLLESKEGVVATNSASVESEFGFGEFDEDSYDELVSYLEEKIEEQESELSEPFTQNQHVDVSGYNQERHLV